MTAPAGPQSESGSGQGVTAAGGFRASGVVAGLKDSGRPDVALVVNEGPGRAAAGVFTRNKVKAAPVLTEGPRIERHPRFPRRVNAGYMEIVSRREIRLRVYERGAGETLACGTGACAAVVSGIHCGLLDDVVEVATRGGPLTIRWQGGQSPVMMIGQAATVFSAEVDVPAHPALPERSGFAIQPPIRAT